MRSMIAPPFRMRRSRRIDSGSEGLCIWLDASLTRARRSAAASPLLFCLTLRMKIFSEATEATTFRSPAAWAKLSSRWPDRAPSFLRSRSLLLLG